MQRAPCTTGVEWRTTGLAGVSANDTCICVVRSWCVEDKMQPRQRHENRDNQEEQECFL